MSGEQYDAPNQQVVRADGSAPWDEGSGGSGEGEPAAAAARSESKLPRHHGELDALAAERGHEWSSDDLTVAEKQQELGG